MKGNVRQKAGQVAGRAQSTAGSVVNRVRYNPMPAALIGAGIAWLTMRGGNRAVEDDSYREGARGWIDTLMPAVLAAGSVSYLFVNRSRGSSAFTNQADETASALYEGAQRTQGAARETVHRAAEVVRSTTRQARDRAGEIGAGVQERWATVKDRTGSEFDRWLRENPLALGIAAAAAGATLGLLIPRTQTEDEVMGETRDSLIRMAQEAAQQTAEKVKAAAHDAASNAGSSGSAGSQAGSQGGSQSNV